VSQTLSHAVKTTLKLRIYKGVEEEFTADILPVSGETMSRSPSVLHVSFWLICHKKNS
jgi:hypothetical protein